MVSLRVLAPLSCVAFVLLVAAGGTVSATTITYDVGYAFQESPPSTVVPPYVQATFTDLPSGGVELLMSAVNLGSGVYVGDWFFNEDAVNLSLLTITYVGGIPAAVSKDADAYLQGGAGKYDIRFAFPTGNPNERFAAGDSSTYRFTGGGITAADFAVLSVPHGNGQTFHTIAQIQGEGGWFADSAPVPEPGSFGLLAAGSVLLLGSMLVRRGFLQPRESPVASKGPIA